jgi:2-polyprenyl-6-methoxyphenol hydroxylase-like FAD-dependent oxidoreductase
VLPQRLHASPIVDIVPERLARGRTVLVGDPGAVLRPHSASGISKAVQNVFALAEKLNKSEDLGQAIMQWETEKLETLAQQSRLAQSLGRGMVTDAPDWDRMTTEDMPGWWESMIAGKSWFVDDERFNAAKSDA